MSDIALGDMCRQNFGIRKKYETELRSEYKAYIDELQYSMMSAIYGTDENACIITRSHDLLQTQEEIDSCLGEIKYKELENALIYFCKIHNVNLNIERLYTTITITVDMLLKFNVVYT